MAVGVHESRYDIVETLDYWLTELKQCSTKDNNSTCYNGKNMADLWTKWIETGKCNEAAEEQKNFHRFTLDDFISIFGIMWIMGFIAIIHAMWKNRALLLLRMKKKKHVSKASRELTAVPSKFGVVSNALSRHSSWTGFVRSILITTTMTSE